MTDHVPKSAAPLGKAASVPRRLAPLQATKLAPHRRKAAEHKHAEFMDAYDGAIGILRSTFSPKNHHVIADTLSAYRDVLARGSKLRAHIDRRHEIQQREITDIFRDAQFENRRK